MIYFKSQVDALLKTKDEVISVLVKENERLRVEIEIEARRANNAVDRLLNQAQVSEITPGPKRKTPNADEIIKSVQAAVRIGQEFKGDETGG